MHFSLLYGCPVYEPDNNNELAQWLPCEQENLQFVKIARGQYWIFHGGKFLGCAQQITGLNAWQASSDELGYCIAPLASLLECAQCLLEYQNEF